jgi:magnesium-transporting ATPase (P-type)
MADQTPQNGQKKGGYGKRPMWQWILFYVIVAAVVYYVVYYFFFMTHGTAGGSGTLPGY